MNGWYPMMYPPPQMSLKDLIDRHKAEGEWLKTLKENGDKKKTNVRQFEWWEVGIILYALSKPMYLLLDHWHLLPLFQ